MGELLGVHERAAVIDELTPPVPQNVRGWPMFVQSGNSLDPLAGNELLTPKDLNARRSAYSIPRILGDPTSGRMWPYCPSTAYLRNVAYLRPIFRASW